MEANRRLNFILTGLIVFWLLLHTAAASLASPARLTGDWKTPGNSIVRVETCGELLCLTLIKVAPDVKVSTDTQNPDPSLRSRPLCGLRIGDSFRPEGESAATGGRLYDPEAGKTYSGKMTVDGERLKLRGYIGVSLFGRSEVWTRVAGPTQVCK